MEIVAIISIFTTGVLTGIIAIDFRSRYRLQQELRTTLEKISNVHNDLTKQVVELHSRVDTHEMRLSPSFKKS